MLDIHIKTLLHNKQRYDTVGDWYDELGDKGFVRVSDLGNEYEEVAVALHELVEKYLCRKLDISQEVVDAFDYAYEKNRKKNDYSEPGDSRYAPYHKQHKFATKIEKMFIKELGLDWKNYESKINTL